MVMPPINKITVYRHQLHFKQPAGTSRGVYLTRKLWLVALSTDSYTAVGECAPLPDLSCDATTDEKYEQRLVEFCSELLHLSQSQPHSQSQAQAQAQAQAQSLAQAQAQAQGQSLIQTQTGANQLGERGGEKEGVASAGAWGKDELDAKWIDKAAFVHEIVPEPLHTRMQDYPSMLFGLESALLELKARSLVFSQSPFTQGQGLQINGLIWMGDFEQMFSRLKDKMAQGFKCIKLKIGAIDFEKELALLSHIREHFTPEQIEIRVDANGAFKVGDALSKLERLSKFKLHSIEQPIKAGQWSAMQQLCQQPPLPIALDEELIGVNQRASKIELLDTIRPHYIILKPSLHGGLSGALEWIELAQARHIGYWITSALESNIGLNVIAQFAGLLRPNMPQGLGTGQLFTDNIDYPLHIKQDALFLDASQAKLNPPAVLAYLEQSQAQVIATLHA